MNYLRIIVIAVFFIFMLRGYQKGIIRTLATSVSLIFSLFLVSFVNPYVTEFLVEHTPVNQIVIERCEKAIPMESVEQAGKQMQEQAINALPFPEVVRKLLKNNNTEEVYSKLSVRNFRDYVTHFIANLMIRLISVLLSWLIIFCVLRVVMAMLDLISELPVIHGVNQILGMGLGTIEALMIVWILFLVITVVSNTEIGTTCMHMISESRSLQFLYDRNVLLWLFLGKA